MCRRKDSRWAGSTSPKQWKWIKKMFFWMNQFIFLQYRIINFCNIFNKLYQAAHRRQEREFDEDVCCPRISSCTDLADSTRDRGIPELGLSWRDRFAVSLLHPTLFWRFRFYFGPFIGRLVISESVKKGQIRFRGRELFVKIEDWW